MCDICLPVASFEVVSFVHVSGRGGTFVLQDTFNTGPEFLPEILVGLAQMAAAGKWIDSSEN